MQCAGMNKGEDLEWYNFEHKEQAEPAVISALIQSHAVDPALQVLSSLADMNVEGMLMPSLYRIVAPVR